MFLVLKFVLVVCFNILQLSGSKFVEILLSTLFFRVLIVLQMFFCQTVFVVLTLCPDMCIRFFHGLIALCVSHNAA